MSMLYESIKSQLNKALKNRDMQTATTLRTLISELKNFAIQQKVSVEDLQDSQIQQILAKQAKQRIESIEAFKKGGRPKLVQKEQKELELIQEYLPKELSQEETKKAVELAIKEQKAESLAQMGQVMAYLKQKYGAKINMQTASQIVKELLSP